ncbi:hypothetical protein [Tahibacter harae]|uniref:Regulator of Chromosome Condensation (RCC1) repeat protein n=1 Tax=Tahibacter harae TaxID=2963937 RepID=A0ABT1QY92_9GAMM|nr:hypothetical protein [Tahibacter harae]MCQ4167260.1 hypothetical protein [Tahibacter harae]
MTPEIKQKLRHFAFVDCAVRSAGHFYLMATHVYALDEDSDDPDGAPAAPADPEADLRAAIRVAVYFPQRPAEKQWALRTLRNIEFMRCAVADAPAAQLIGVSLDGQVYALGNGVSEFEPRITEDRHGPLRGSVRQVLAIDGLVYAVQGNRGLCRRSGPGRWESLCADLPVSGWWKQRDSLGFTCAAATSASNIYCAGGDGDLWYFDGGRWTELRFPGDSAVAQLRCAAADEVCIASQDGSIYRGSGDAWKQIGEGGTMRSCRSLVAYRGRVWGSSDYGLWTIDGDRVAKAGLPADLDVPAGVLSARDGILLAAGGSGAAYFDGERWTGILDFL